MHSCTLRAVTSNDADALHEMLSLAPVYEYLCDGAAPDRSAVDAWLTEACATASPCGLWLLENQDGRLLGCVRLSAVADDPQAVELTYVLHPDQWGRGLAAAMSRSAISHAFAMESCERVVAGTDVGNTRSVDVMRRLGMQFLRDVQYPAGPGVEYQLTRLQSELMPEEDAPPFV